jgi:hypothetical protein
MLKFGRKLWGWGRPSPLSHPIVFNRPVVLLQSDDWGRLGVRDREGFKLLQEAGLMLGEAVYDFYSLETAEDVTALHELLLQHRDSTGRPPCLVMNFVTANIDFLKTAAGNFHNIHLMPLAEGLPGEWKRPGLLNAYRRGIADGVFYPALHGMTHFCRPAVEHELAKSGERAELLHTLWKSETPYIYWRMPWVGYEYWNPQRRPKERFLPGKAQADLIRQSVEHFVRLFATSPLSACAPGYRANEDTHRAWEQCGIRVVQSGTGSSVPSHVSESGVLRLYRNIDFEPAVQGSLFSVEECVQLAEENLRRGLPAVVSVHSINLQSSLKDFRGPTLKLLDQFLTTLEREHPDLLYLHDADMYGLVTHGRYDGPGGPVTVTVTQETVNLRQAPARRRS